MDSMAKFSGRSLPNKNEFFSSLSMADITEEEYTHAKTVWDSFEV